MADALRCPKCRNKGFVPTRDVPRPIHNMGGKVYTPSGTEAIRRYVCLQCGYKWKTTESFYEEILVQTELPLSRPDRPRVAA